MSNHLNLRFVLRFLLVLSCLNASIPTQAQQADAELIMIGEIGLAKGVVTARSDARPITALAKGSPVYLGDIIETATRSFVVILFNDGGKVTLRPDSRFDLNEYDDTLGQEKESFALLKGGLRAVTGAIGKAKPEDVSYTARNTTIGIRGTTFVISLCQEGDEHCDFSNDPDQNQVEGNDNLVDIIIVDKDGGTQQRLTREQLLDILIGVYVSVLDGAIRVDNGRWYIDMFAGDKCLVDYSDDGGTVRESNEEVECFIRGRGIEDIDVFLSANAEDIAEFNLFDDGELFVGDEICEIN